MRAVTLALSMTSLSMTSVSMMSLLMMLGLAVPSNAETVGTTFKLTLCNKYRAPVKVALVHLTGPDENQFLARGWFGLDSNQCGDGDVPRGEFAVFAYAGTPDNAQKIWGGNIRICVAPKRDFQNVLASNSRCKPDEILVGFQAFPAPTEAEVSFVIE